MTQQPEEPASFDGAPRPNSAPDFAPPPGMAGYQGEVPPTSPSHSPQPPPGQPAPPPYPPSPYAPSPYAPSPYAPSPYAPSPSGPASTGSAPRAARPRRALLVGAGVLAGVLVLAIVGTVLAMRGIIPIGPRPAESTGSGLPNGTLPSQPPLPSPPVVAELTKLGLTCMDEMVTPQRIKGCYSAANGHLVQVRMQFDAQGAIEKFLVQVLDSDAKPADRAAETLKLADLMYEAARVDEADRATIAAAVTQERELTFEPGTWGELYVAHSPNTNTISVSRPGLPYIDVQEIVTDFAAFRTSLEKQGFTCEVKDTEYTCIWQQDSRYQVYGAVDGQVVRSLSVFYPIKQPAPVDHPVMVATYAALTAGGGPHVEAVRQGLARMAMDKPELLFSGGFRISYWDIQYEVSTVAFA